MTQLTWLVTGCSSGLGEEFIRGILSRGDKAIATSRGPISRIQKLKEAGASTYSLDVSAPKLEVDSIMSLIIQENGGIDVLVNNAGYVENGTLEESSRETILAQYETNLFGSIKATQALLPHFRQKRSGTVVFIGSMYGWGGLPSGLPYASSKFALEGVHESLKESVAHLGIKSIIFELGFFRTQVLHPNNFKSRISEIGDYDALRAGTAEFLQALQGNEPGDPKKGIKVMIDVVKGEGVAAGKAMPERLPLGVDALDLVRKKCEDTLAICKEWEHIINSTNFD
ncbi:short-chain oxidoreductase [Mytilinidion resinicola]|uniref:Short-chain oxidoreductase n=1 Tax=Mytilinidion resinicola TaxID=574789 RepID=A0A6A6Y5U2_9PEZI|nr:short-chain oxidoreductase [Mytilinidion resinicola]KAF2803394.1 short-chain oxidoreductase [Mytilinidion resinicola]